MPTEMIEEWPLPDIFEEGISGEMYPVHLEYQDIGDGVPRFALSSDCGDIPLDAVNVQVSRLRSENAQLQGQQSAVRDMAASEVDDLKEEISIRDRRIAELEEQVDYLVSGNESIMELYNAGNDSIAELKCLSREGVELVLGNIDLDPAALKAWARRTEKVLPDAD